MFDPARDYERSIDKGCEKDFTDQSDDYKTRREESIDPEKKYKVIMSPSRASFFLDMGSEVKVFQGECHRRAFFNIKSFPVTNSPGALSIRKMRYGQVFETEEHKFEEGGGILIKKNYRMNKEISKDVLLSCEVDSIVKLSDGKQYIAEIKSYDGYYGIKHICGNKSRRGMPKYDHVAQNMLYLAITPEYFKDVSTTIFHYRKRSDMHPQFHILELDVHKDSAGNVIDAYPIINGTKHTFVSLKGLISRGLLLAQSIIRDKLPPRDPEFSYNEDKIRYLLSIDEVAKSRYKAWQEGASIIGDWQCSRLYCRYCQLCLGDNPQDQSSWPSDNDIMTKLGQHTVDKIDDINTSIWD